mmetsp:Transcript_13825/g.19001  ORF Transcript_13825/g.19001 Transcript_13825/m.19001 type:complete len:163 (+) Transcript_13825:41-529(+)
MHVQYHMRAMGSCSTAELSNQDEHHTFVCALQLHLRIPQLRIKLLPPSTPAVVGESMMFRWSVIFIPRNGKSSENMCFRFSINAPQSEWIFSGYTCGELQIQCGIPAEVSLEAIPLNAGYLRSPQLEIPGFAPEDLYFYPVSFTSICILSSENSFGKLVRCS